MANKGSTDPAQWLKWYNELDPDDEPPLDDESDSDDPNYVQPSANHDSESEQEASDVEDDADNEEDGNEFIAKDGTKWNKVKSNSAVRTRKHNILVHSPGPKFEAREAKSIEDCWNLFFNDEIVNLVTESTNIYIQKIKSNFSRDRDARLTDVIEIRALIGILYFIGIRRSSRLNISKMWDNSKGGGLEACYLAMSEKRFRFLMRCLRFDDVSDRPTRKAIDKLAPIRQILDQCLQNFQKFYSPSDQLTIDEQLLAFRGRCSFRQYIPSKPAKYGVKVFALVDCKNMYTVNLEVYCGRQPEGPFAVNNSPTEIVERLAKPILGSGRNITGDNWFSSIPLAKSLLQKKISYVGTIKKNKREIPKEFLPNKSRDINTSIFGFQQWGTLLSYCQRKSKATILISTMHHGDEIDDSSGDKKKPEIVTFYNKTKVGVDVVDQLCNNYNVARNTRRWPMVIFFDLVNICGINALCIHVENNQYRMKRSEFLEELSWSLIKPQIERRSQIPQVSVEIRRRARLLLGIQNQEVPDTSCIRAPRSRGRCHICGRSRNKISRRYCKKCDKWVCPDHSKDVCAECFEDSQE